MKKKSFQQIVWNFYKQHGREFPWRTAAMKLPDTLERPPANDQSKVCENQYRVFVSEIMLQQTQASRVVPKYEQWINRWSSFQSLAAADRSAILKAWQGLGYNRRAKFLHQSAQKITTEHNNSLPEAANKLKQLPGVGPYTTGALQAFCFNKPVIFVETNIRTVFIHHFFTNQKNISDEMIKDKIKETLPNKNMPSLKNGDSSPYRQWYWALMDYGTHLKKTVGNLNQQSKTYQTQSKFEGSNRQLRSRILQFTLANEPVSLTDITQAVNSDTKRQKSVQENLNDLCEEEMIKKHGDVYEVKN